ncbi:Protein IN2-1 -like protein B [Capsicum annuum]|nr:Protein IN2-1 -like protein B [Capsicum annuum]
MVKKKLKKKCEVRDEISVQEIRPSSLLSTSEPPSLFDGTTRLYISYICPFAQRAWITRNVKGLQDKIELVPIDLQNRPAWYKEKVYPQNKVPALEHNNKVIGESLDLIKYIDSNFEGPSLLPDDPEKQKFAEELVAYTDTFLKEIYGSFKGDVEKQAGPQFDYVEKALEKFDNGPFFLGQFSQADIAYASFIERFQIFLQEVFNYDITSGRPKLAKWIEELNKIDGYIQTKADPKKVVEIYKSRFMVVTHTVDITCVGASFETLIAWESRSLEVTVELGVTCTMALEKVTMNDLMAAIMVLSTLSYGSHEDQLVCENGDVEHIGRSTMDDPLVVFVVDHARIGGIYDCTSGSIGKRKCILNPCPWTLHPFDPSDHLKYNDDDVFWNDLNVHGIYGLPISTFNTICCSKKSLCFLLDEQLLFLVPCHTYVDRLVDSFLGGYSSKRDIWVYVKFEPPW